MSDKTLISANSEKPSAERKGWATPVRLAPYGVYAVSLVAQGLADFVYKTVNIFVNYLAPCQYWREPNCLQCDGVEVIKGGGFLKSYYIIMQRSSRSRSDWRKWFFLFRALQEKVHLDVSHFEKLLSEHGSRSSRPP